MSPYSAGGSQELNLPLPDTLLAVATTSFNDQCSLVSSVLRWWTGGVSELVSPEPCAEDLHDIQ